MRYFHGGRANLQKGNFILPPVITQAKSMASFGNKDCDRAKVYVTTSFEAAAMYAAGVLGDVYEVEPVGELGHDPDCLVDGLSYSCNKARILKCFRLKNNERQAILRELVKP